MSSYDASFSKQLREMVEKAKADARGVFNETVALVDESIRTGSPITGAPGQPVDDGNLLRSWQTGPVEPLLSETVTKTLYAPAIEDGVQEEHTRKAHTRKAYTRSDGTEVREAEVAESKLIPRREITFRSEVGGAHSVKLTVAGFDKLVAEAVKRQVG